MAARSTNPRHHVVIGSGVAGSQAAHCLRGRDPEARITIITLSSLPFYNRYDLPQVFRGRHDWREFVVYPRGYYEAQRIALRRETSVTNVDARRKKVILGHNEELNYDTLLVASGGRSYLPEELAEYRPLLDTFTSFNQAMAIRRKLPEGGCAILLGGDMIGLDLARSLLDTGHRVVLVAGEYTFWPHQVTADEQATLFAACSGMGMDVVASECLGGIAAIEQGAKGMPARRVVFGNGEERYGDVVIPFFGLAPSVEFMLGSGVDIERGLLVSAGLRTTNEAIYAAGDVCQIWSAEENRYRFYYGWKNVRAMGEVAAANMTGESDIFGAIQDETLHLSPDRGIHSPFWEYA